MPGIKKLNKIKSVKHAQDHQGDGMVAASKCKAQERMRAGRPYATKVR